jgi:hypothetical protein
VTKRPPEIGLGPLVAALGFAATVVIAVWAWLAVHGGADFDGTLAVAATMAAAFYVALLAAIAILDALAWAGHGLPFVRVLSNRAPRLRPDWLVPAGLAAGLVLGKTLWP